MRYGKQDIGRRRAWRVEADNETCCGRRGHRLLIAGMRKCQKIARMGELPLLELRRRGNVSRERRPGSASVPAQRARHRGGLGPLTVTKYTAHSRYVDLRNGADCAPSQTRCWSVACMRDGAGCGQRGFPLVPGETAVHWCTV